MRPQLTKEEIDLIRPAFNSNGKSGILENIISTGRERIADIPVNPDELKKAYAKLGYVGVVKLIEFIETKGADLKEIGTSSIDLAGVTGGPFSIENALSLQELHIGSFHKGLSPLQWLSYLAEGLANVIPEQIKAFDDICGELVAVAEVVKRDDVF